MSTRRTIVIKKRTPAPKLIPDAYKEFLGRINKILPRTREDTKITRFEVIEPKTGFSFICSSRYFSPIMVGDAIYGKGFVDEDGKAITLSRPPFIGPGNDNDSVVQFCYAALGPNGSKLYLSPLIGEIKKMLMPGESLASCFDHLANSYNKRGKNLLNILVIDSLQDEMSKLLKWWYRKRCLRRLYLLELTNTEIKSSGFDPNELYTICLENPYRIPSISLEKCENILLRLSKKLPEKERRCGEIMRYLGTFLASKWSVVPKKLLEERYPDLDTHEELLMRDYGVSFGDKWIALEKNIKIEQNVAAFIESLLSNRAEILQEEALAKLDKFLDDFRCDPDQRAAIKGIIENPITVVTGAAGTGKTTLLRALTGYLDARGDEYILASPTGKAVARIKDIVPRTIPVTLHRLIAMPLNSEKQGLTIIIDETSMVDTGLSNELITKYSQVAKLVLIGDVNQLSPIGWGCFYEQIIASERIPTYYLTQNHRSEGSGIIENSHRLLDGGFFEATADFQLCFGEAPLDIIKRNGLDNGQVRVLAPYTETVTKLNSVLQEYFAGASPYLEDSKGRKWHLQDRVMMTKNNYTIDVMNGQEGLVSYFDCNDEGIHVSFEGKVHLFTFTNVDLEKVLDFWPPSRGHYLNIDTYHEMTPGQAKACKWIDHKHLIAGNNRELFNTLCYELSVKKELKANGEDSEDTRSRPPVDHLIHSYALTIHKSQGSEWDHVIVVLPRSRQESFITKQLIYTAITRAKKCVYCVGDKPTWLRGCNNAGNESKQLLSYLLRKDAEI